MYIYIILSLIPILFNKILSFKLNTYEPAIGKWNLLYSNNNIEQKHKKLCLDIHPLKNNEISVKIKRYESYNLITYIKIVKCKAYNNNCEELLDKDNCLVELNDDEDGNICSLIVLTAEKNIKSIGMFEFPYFSINYNSGFNPEYTIVFKVDNNLDRLYIYFDKNIYVFQRKKNEQILDDDNIISNTFIISNIISFILGKLLERTLNIN
jgi:hypothetical protein